VTGSVKVWVLAFVVAAGVGFGAIVGIGCALGANACPFSKPKPFTSTDGEVIWLARCAFCHGRDGKGDRGPSLVTGEAAGFTLEELESKIARGKPLAGMPMFKRELTQQQIEAVARYVMKLREAA
jgi:mono/diheme cytochrome c family protein